MVGFVGQGDVGRGLVDDVKLCLKMKYQEAKCEAISSRMCRTKLWLRGGEEMGMG